MASRRLVAAALFASFLGAAVPNGRADDVRYYENNANLWGNQVVALCLTVVGVVLLIVFLRWPNKQARPDAGRK